MTTLKNQKRQHELASFVGVNRDDFYEEDTGSQGAFLEDDFNDAVERAYSNNYDVRRSIEAARLSGADGVPKHITNIEDAYAAHKFMRDTHKNELGGDGHYMNLRDAAAITRHWVDRDRDNFTTDLNGQMENMLDEALGSQNDKDTESEEEGEVVYSDKLRGSKERLAAAARTPSSLYSENNGQVSTNNDQKDGTKHFFDEKKLGLAQGLNLQDAVYDNLTNAASTVTNIYGR